MVMFIFIWVFSKLSSSSYSTIWFEIGWQDDADELCGNWFSPSWHCIMCFPLMVNPICKQMYAHVFVLILKLQQHSLCIPHIEACRQYLHFLASHSPSFHEEGHLEESTHNTYRYPVILMAYCKDRNNLMALCEGNHPVFVHTVTLPL